MPYNVILTPTEMTVALGIIDEKIARLESELTQPVQDKSVASDLETIRRIQKACENARHVKSNKTTYGDDKK